jgi:hypothetical protein
LRNNHVNIRSLPSWGRFVKIYLHKQFQSASLGDVHRDRSLPRLQYLYGSGVISEFKFVILNIEIRVYYDPCGCFQARKFIFIKWKNGAFCAPMKENMHLLPPQQAVFQQCWKNYKFKHRLECLSIIGNFEIPTHFFFF